MDEPIDSLKRARLAAHEIFDHLWKHAPKGQRKQARRDMYKWLARELGIPETHAHFSVMHMGLVVKATELCRARLVYEKGARADRRNRENARYRGKRR